MLSLVSAIVSLRSYSNRGWTLIRTSSFVRLLLVAVLCGVGMSASACIVRVDDDEPSVSPDAGEPGTSEPPSDRRSTPARDTSEAPSSDIRNPDASPQTDAELERRDVERDEGTGDGTNDDATEFPGLGDISNGSPSDGGRPDTETDEPDTSPPPECRGRRMRCLGDCIDPRTHDDHCDSCQHSCASGEICVNRSCQPDSPVRAVMKYSNKVRSTPTDCGQYGQRQALPPVTGNDELHRAAQAHAESMANNDFFAHEDPTDRSDFVVRIRRTNYSGSPLGENISAGGRGFSARSVVRGWEQSEGHCRNLADSQATDIGVGYAESNSATYGAYWVQVFGRGGS